MASRPPTCPSQLFRRASDALIGPLTGVLADPALDRLTLPIRPDRTRLGGEPEPPAHLATVLAAGLEHAAGILDRLAAGSASWNRQGQRLLAR